MSVIIRGEGDDRVVVSGETRATFTGEGFGDGVLVATSRGDLVRLELNGAGRWTARVVAAGISGRLTVHQAPDGDEYVVVEGGPLVWVAVVDQHHVTPPMLGAPMPTPRPRAGHTTRTVAGRGLTP